jgi:LPXTG-motif cell wall-anchored protein
MKKVLALLLVLGVLLMYPLDTFAASAAYLPSEPSKKVDNGDGTMTYYYPVSLNNTGSEATADFTKVEITFSYGPAIKSFTCGDAGKFTASQTNAAAGAACTFTASEADPGKGSEIQVGTITVVVNKNAPDEDCTIKYTYKGAEGKIVPETGVSIPYAIIAGGAVLAVGVYFATKKKTKLQRI